MNTFDPSSGQIFRETTVRGRRNRDPAALKWYYASRGGRIQPLEPLQRHSPTLSLERLALEALLKNIKFVEDGALDTLPLLLAQKCWYSVKQK